MQVKDKDYAIHSIKAFIKSIENDLTIHSVFLFGSYLNGHNTQYSDIDFAVVINRTVDYELDMSLFEKAQQYNSDLEPVIYSIEDFNKEYSDLIVEIKHKGEKIA